MDEKKYTSKIIKVAAHIPDAKIFLSEWNEGLSSEENLDNFVQHNIFGKPSRVAVKNVLNAFKERFLLGDDSDKALRKLVKADVDQTVVNRILYYHTALADKLLYDFVTQYLYGLYLSADLFINTLKAQVYIQNLSKEGKTTAIWSEKVCNRVARNILTTLRDFDLLEGKVKKKITPPYLPTEAFVYVAYLLYRQNLSGEKIVNHEDWKLFLLDPSTVERMFIDAHQNGYLIYNAAGSIIRINFNFNNIEGIVDAIIERTVGITGV
jgi:hypothetical protein